MVFFYFIYKFNTMSRLYLIIMDKKNVLLFFGCLIFVLGSCADRNDEKKERTSLMDLGSDFDSIIKESRSVLDKFNGWEHRVYYGIDISHYQGDILNRMESTDSLHFIVTKATEGTDYIDPDFKKNWKEIKEKGLIRGAYHFYRFEDGAIDQAKHFITQISSIEYSDIAPIVDVEAGSLDASVSKQNMHDELLDFLKKIESSLKRKPIIYTNTSFANEYLNNSDFANYELWLAEYTKGTPKIPEIWQDKGYLIWQRTPNYKNFSTTIDFDVFHGRLNELLR